MPLLATFIVPHPPMILPEIGKGDESKVQKTIDSYLEISKEIASLKPETIIVISPHALAYSDCFYLPLSKTLKGSFQRFGVKSVGYEMTNDIELTKSIISYAHQNDIEIYSTPSRPDELDHGVMVPLYFIHKYYQDFSIVRISLSGLSIKTHYQMGQAIYQAVNQLLKRAVIVASGDLSHKLTPDGPYGFAAEGPIYDKRMIEAFDTGDFFQLLTIDDYLYQKAADCGRKSFVIMAGALDGYTVKSRLLSYEGPYGVGYAVASFYPLIKDSSRQFLHRFEDYFNDAMNETRIKEGPYVHLARQSLEYYLEHHKIMGVPSDLPKELTDSKAGVFVSLKINHELRGCIGTISPTADNIALEIIQNAISAGMKDPRFLPVRSEELKNIVYSVDVLAAPEPVHDIIELDPVTYGVIVKYHQRTGLLLPNLEGVDTVEEQLSIALRKAGINPNDPYSIYKFKVIRHN